MNKKGFTLVELLGIIVILAIIISVVFPGVAEVLRKSKKTVRDIQINKILDSAYDYTLKNIDLLPDKDEVTYITLNELKKENLIDSDIKDTTNNVNFSDDLVISIRKAKKKNNLNAYSKFNGSFLYTVEFEFMNSSDYENNRPIINFVDYETNPLIINLNIGDLYTPVKYTATSIDGIDLTSKVVENIICNSKRSNKVDTSKAGVYYVNYSVVDKNGYSNLSTVSIVVSDIEKPVLIIPSNETISTDVTNYDLLNGVSCEDNSGNCDIKINGSINFGVSDKYIIEYVASDPSGNTTIEKRVITIE